MPTPDVHDALRFLFSELTEGAKVGGGAFILNSGDVGLLESLDHLPAEEASRSVDGGATIAAHAQHVRYGLSLMNRWATGGGNPFADARWDEAWKLSAVRADEWDDIRRGLRVEAQRWRDALAAQREVMPIELNGMIGSVAHIAYHLGAIRQIARRTRGPREGTFSFPS